MLLFWRVPGDPNDKKQLGGVPNFVALIRDETAASIISHNYDFSERKLYMDIERPTL